MKLKFKNPKFQTDAAKAVILTRRCHSRNNATDETLQSIGRYCYLRDDVIFMTTLSIFCDFSFSDYLCTDKTYNNNINEKALICNDIATHLYNDVMY